MQFDSGINRIQIGVDLHNFNAHLWTVVEMSSLKTHNPNEAHYL